MSLAWAPSFDRRRLQVRAEFMARIRQFFGQRAILEVETPILSCYGSTDLHLHSFTSVYQPVAQQQGIDLYLQTSPEFAMKRLLAADSGAIFQLCKCFRNGEAGRYHHPEFTLLEWYRPGFDHHQLMQEVDDFLQYMLGTPVADRQSYQALFEHYLGFDPHTATLGQLQEKLSQMVEFADHEERLNFDKDTLLQLLMMHGIEPHIGNERPLMVYDFPASQAALAKILPGQPPVAARFEVYYQGVELANGFDELTDAKEQRQRFQHDQQQRKIRKLPVVPMDEQLLAAMTAGLPECAGVALGVDRLLMLAEKLASLEETLSFTGDYL